MAWTKKSKAKLRATLRAKKRAAGGQDIPLAAIPARVPARKGKPSKPKRYEPDAARYELAMALIGALLEVVRK